MSGLPPWFDKDREKINQKSRKQERQHAEETKGRMASGSGSSWRDRGDVSTPIGEDGEGFTDQLKFTSRLGYRISVDEWASIKRDAALTGRTPRLIIDFESTGLRLVVQEP